MFVLDNGTELYVVQSERSTHTVVDFNIYAKLGKENAARTLSSFVMMEGSRNFPTKHAVSLATDREYGASFMLKTGSLSDIFALGFYLEVLTDEAFTSGRKTLENMVALASDMLLEPLMDGNKFKEDYFELKKKELLTIVLNRNLDKDYRAYKGFLGTALEKGSIFLLPSSGTAEQIAGLTNKETVKAYLKVLKKPRKVFVSTNLQPEYIREVIERNFKSMRKNRANVSMGKIPGKKGPIKIEDPSEFRQSVAYAAFPLDVPDDTRERQALFLLNHCLGGYHNSRLFKEVRMKRKLAYSTNSNVDMERGLIYGRAGVDLKNKDKAVDVILDELSKIADGKISRGDFEGAKRSMLNLKRITLHHRQRWLNFIESCVLRGAPEGIGAYEERYEDITHGDVVNAASLLKKEPIIYCQLQKEKNEN